MTPLMHAVKGGHIKIAEMLLKYGVDGDIWHTRVGTPLLHVVKGGGAHGDRANTYFAIV
jgi:hypothetical protein